MEIRSGYITIIGKPNVGKSTLMNALLGERLSIVTNKPQTTRKRILGIVSEENYQAIFVDTPGILEPNYLLQEKMLAYVIHSGKDADLLICIIDIKADPQGKETLENKTVKNLFANPNQKKILLINKIDLSNEKAVLELIDKMKETNLFEEIIPMTAISLPSPKGLMDIFVEYLPVHPKFFPDDQLTDEPERFFVSEIIREKIFETYHEEVPFSTEVLIEEFNERKSGKDYILAFVIVERESQKPLMIGKQGAAIKNLGRVSREAIEKFLQREVFLEIRVKVKPKWRSDTNMLKNFGYDSWND